MLAGTWALLVGCIIPDKGITLEVEIPNPGAVRIVERPPTTPQQYALCNYDDDPDDDVVEEGYLEFCPPVRRDRLSGLVRGGPHCICPGPVGDHRAIPTFSIYAEDPDRDRDGDDPSDTLYGVLLLDPDPNSTTPQNDVAYTTYLDPCDPGRLLREPEGYTPLPGGRADWTAFSEARDPPFMWEFKIDDATGSGVVDLCNDNSGRSVTPGLHNLQFMVTDRPFFAAPLPSGSGMRGQCGVPDLSPDEGATYAVTNFVFECLDPADEGSDCDCDDAG